MFFNEFFYIGAAEARDLSEPDAGEERTLAGDVIINPPLAHTQPDREIVNGEKTFGMSILGLGHKSTSQQGHRDTWCPGKPIHAAPQIARGSVGDGKQADRPEHSWCVQEMKPSAEKRHGHQLPVGSTFPPIGGLCRPHCALRHLLQPRLSDPFWIAPGTGDQWIPDDPEHPVAAYLPRGRPLSRVRPFR